MESRDIDEKITQEQKIAELNKLKLENARVKDELQQIQNKSAPWKSRPSKEKVQIFWANFDARGTEIERLKGQDKMHKLNELTVKNLAKEYHTRLTESMSDITTLMRNTGIKKETWEKILIEHKDGLDEMKNKILKVYGGDFRPPCRFWERTASCNKLDDPKHMGSYHHAAMCKFGVECRISNCIFVHPDLEPSKKD